MNSAIANRMKQVSLHGRALALIAVLFFLIHTWAYVNEVYHNVPRVDVPIHILFGVWLALLLLHPIFRERRLTLPAIFGAVMVVGVGWEFLEYIYDTVLTIPRGLPTAQHGVAETIRDLLCNGTGAAVTLTFFRSKKYFW
ncbi:MAG: hypothetical protein G01um10148_517 [Parcubacteria group bacterium Gr01-1014_8]|nr:MAG: hypothetical protein G01um10148_517 [Parcubacteria group bacterium Gr01-1014_8]